MSILVHSAHFVPFLFASFPCALSVTLRFESIKAAAYSFNDPVWDNVSDLAKDLVSKILVADPARRLKAADILKHPWMTVDDAVIPDVNLDAARDQLRRFQARRRLKKAIQGIRSTIRMKLLLAAKTAAAAERSAGGGAEGGGSALGAAAGGGSNLAAAMANSMRLAKEREAAEAAGR
jgi:hypothetical protein